MNKMAIKEVLNFDSDILHTKCERVLEINEEIKSLIKDLKDTLYDGTGVGLAAPQIGVLKRVILVDLREGEGPIVLINPKIISQAGKVNDVEGCLSYPGYVGEVVRPKRVTVIGKNPHGKKVTYKAEGFLARAFCHEIDHLDGIVYTDRTKVVYREEEEES
jgi:peptide deformylase